MQVYGLKEDDKKIVFNDASVRGLIIKIRSFEDQQTIAGLFNNATQGMLRGCKLAEFDSNATDFAQKIKDFPGGAGGKIEENTGVLLSVSAPSKTILRRYNERGQGSFPFHAAIANWA